ncbi:Maf family nucleotide pyrophosphatase [soil metagenome]
MELLGVDYSAEPAQIDEPTPGRVESAEAFARALARAKASVVASRNPGRPVLAADTVVSMDGELLGKPSDAAAAVAMLQALRGRAHDVTTGVAVVDPNGQLRVGAATTRVMMRPFSDEEIATSVQSGMPFDKAGGYAIQDESFLPVAHFDGCYCNVVGLPLGLTIGLLREIGVEPPVSEPFRLLPYCLSCPLFGND